VVLARGANVDMGQRSHILHIVAQKEWEGCSFFPQNQGSLVWVKGFLRLLHIFFKLHASLSILI
jgi:hypothetical protein